jgi:hypothetical protein
VQGVASGRLSGATIDACFALGPLRASADKAVFKGSPLVVGSLGDSGMAPLSVGSVDLEFNSFSKKRITRGYGEESDGVGQMDWFRPGHPTRGRGGPDLQGLTSRDALTSPPSQGLIGRQTR